MRTITTNPQEGAVLFPFLECAPLDKPRRSATMLDFACSVMIDGRIRRREPCSEFLLQLVPCEHGSALAPNDSIFRVTNVWPHLSLFWRTMGGQDAYDDGQKKLRTVFVGFRTILCEDSHRFNILIDTVRDLQVPSHYH